MLMYIRKVTIFRSNTYKYQNFCFLKYLGNGNYILKAFLYQVKAMFDFYVCWLYRLSDQNKVTLIFINFLFADIIVEEFQPIMYLLIFIGSLFLICSVITSLYFMKCLRSLLCSCCGFCACGRKLRKFTMLFIYIDRTVVMLFLKELTLLYFASYVTAKLSLM